MNVNRIIIIKKANTKFKNKLNKSLLAFITVLLLSANYAYSSEFIKNQGQLVDETGKSVDHVFFSVRQPGMNIHFTNTGITYHFWKIEYGLHQDIMTEQHRLKDHELEEMYKNGLVDDTELSFYRVDLDFNSNNNSLNAKGTQKRNNYSNYYTAKHPDGLLNVPHFDEIRYEEVYPNIDIVFYFDKGNLKYDIIVKEGGKLSDINFEYVGADELEIDDKGNLIVKCMPGNIVEKTPFSFYKDNQEVIDIRYSIDGLNLNFKSYSEIDESKSIVVDPELIWSTYYNDGSSSATWTSPVMDKDGNIFNAGYTYNDAFPVVNPGGSAWYQATPNAFVSAIIVKFDDTKQPQWVTYYNGSAGNYVAIGFSGGRGGLDVDSNGNIYVIGRTQSSAGQTFPTYDQGGGAYYQTAIYGENPYILKFDNDGVRLWATMFSTETASSSPGYSVRSLRVGNDDQLYIAGECYNWTEGGEVKDFPLRNPGGGAYYKGTRVESQVPTISRFDSNGVLQWSTYISEAPEDTYNSGYGMINDQNDNLFFYGSSSINLPDETWNTVNPGGGAYQDNQGTNGGGRKTLLIKFNPDESMYWSTLFGGEERHSFEGSSGWIWQDFRDIVVDSNGDIILTGRVNTIDFPTLDPGNGAYFQDTHSPGGGWATDGVMTRFTNNGVLQWSTYYGGDWGGVGAGDGTDLQGLAIDGQDNIFVFGHTWAQGFPTQNMTDSYFKGTLGERDYVFMMFDNDNNRQWSTFFGGSVREWGFHGMGSYPTACGIDLFIFGATNSDDYPLVDYGSGALYESTKTTTNANTISYLRFGSDDEYDATILTTGPFCENDDPVEFEAVDDGGEWSGPGISSDGLFDPSTAGSGTHTIVYTIIGPCGTDSDDIEITVNPTPIASISGDTEICDGESTTLTASGGGNYEWNTGSTNATINISTGGTYTVTVTNTYGCTNEAAEIVTVNSNPIASISGDTEICDGESTTLTASGGESYQWSTGSTTNSTSVSSSGTYTVTVTDANSCTAEASELVNVFENPDFNLTVGNHPLCNGDSNGEIDILISTGTPQFLIEWNTGSQNTNNFNYTIDGLSDGNYEVTITDNNGCQSSESISLNEPPVLSSSISSQTNQNCATPGAATVDATGGTPDYTYSWPATADDVTDNHAGILFAGTYDVTISDGNSCETTQSITITDEGELNINLAVNSMPVCPGESNGQVDVVIFDGTADYTINWGTGNDNTSDDTYTITGLAAGNIEVTVTDSNGCTDTDMIVMNDPNFSSEITDLSNQVCSTPGSATVSSIDGTAPYSYNWPPEADEVSDNTANSLTSGTYVVTITDNNSCETTQTINIIDEGAINVNYTIVSEPLCFGDNTGEVEIEILDGTPDFIIDYGLGIINISDNLYTFEDVPAGIYSLDIEDVNGCSTTIDFQVNQPDELSSEISDLTNQVCESPGSATITSSGGTGSHIYNWPPNAEDISNGTAGSLTAGTYLVTITDENNCESIQTINIIDIGNINFNASVASAPSCYGSNDAEVDIQILTGNPNFTIEWGEHSDIISNNNYTIEGLEAGSYNISITDDDGCFAEQNIEVINPPQIEAIFNVVSNVTCFGEADAEVIIIPQGGIEPYNIIWSNPAISGFNPTNLSAGNYEFTVTDSNDCENIQDFSLTQPDEISFTVNITSPSCFGDNGSAEVIPTGGNAPYSILWQDGSTSFINNNIPADTNFAFTITDTNECSNDGSVNIDQTDIFEVSIIGQDVSCFGGNDGSASISIITGGTPPYSYLWSNGSTEDNISDLSSGTYNVTVTDLNNCQAFEEVVINQAEQINTDINTTDANCDGTGGSATVLASGGNGPYNYFWSTGNNDQTISNVPPGNYSVTVVDATNCEETSFFNISTSGNISANISIIDHLLCYGDQNASLEASSANGNDPLNIVWSDGNINATNSFLGAGTYSVTITDSWGCEGFDQITINEPTQIEIDASVVGISCYGDTNGGITLNVSGGTPPYSFLWNNGNTNSQISDLSDGNYAVTVTDNNGCEATESFYISSPTQGVEVVVETENAKCHNENNGKIELSAIGGTAPFEYFVSGTAYNSNGSTHHNLLAGHYQITLTDNNGCTDTTSIFINEPAPLQAVMVTNNPSCFGNNDGSIEVHVSGGTEPYYFFANDNIYDTNYLSGLTAGVYDVIVYDANDCKLKLGTANINDDPRIDCIKIPNAFTPNGDGINDEWIIENIGMFPDAEIMVFNRWGQVLFQARGNQDPWNGKYNGKFVPTGSYIYVIDLRNGTKSYTGVVTVIY